MRYSESSLSWRFLWNINPSAETSALERKHLPESKNIGARAKTSSRK
ncbi:hypothetical protein [Lentibacillus sp. Marseille-P4043]|nr:hypothetical protein [Lentibacillus sp. Marseille-P4043]